MRILVTRPEADCEDMRRVLTAAGHSIVISPLLTILSEPIPDIRADDIAALVITSQNALRALAGNPQLEHLTSVKTFVVGPRTFAMARELGFRHIIEGPGTGAELAELLKDHGLPADGRIVHLAGNKLAFNFAQAFSELGYRAETIRCYRSEPATGFTAEAEEAIRQGQVDLVTLLSPQTANTFVRLIKSTGLEVEARSLSYACISEATCKFLVDEGWSCTHVAAKPNNQEVLALVNRIAAQFQQ